MKLSHTASGILSTDLTSSLDDPLKFDLRSLFSVIVPAFSTAGNDEGDEQGDGTGDGGDGTDTSGDGADGTGNGSGSDDIKDPEKKRLSDEAAANRVKAKQLADELAAAKAKLKEHEDADKSELEKAQRDLKEATEKVVKLEDTTKSQAIRLAFFESGAAAQFRNPSTALRLLRDDLKDIEVDEDGNADAKAIKEKAEALLKAEPYLARSEDDDSGSDEKSTGQLPSGVQTNGKKKSKDDLDMEHLKTKFPALRR